MVTQVKPSRLAPANHTDAPGQPAGAPLVAELVMVKKLLADTLQLASLEARHAVSSALKAIFLLALAAVGAATAAIITIVAAAFALKALGLPWAIALMVVAAAVVALCYVAARVAGNLAYRLTLPETRRAFSATAEFEMTSGGAT